jgi:hypothetical protein
MSVFLKDGAPAVFKESNDHRWDRKAVLNFVVEELCWLATLGV